MFYKCTTCGNIFEEGEEKNCYEYLAEAWGKQIFEKKSYCPSCGSEGFEEAHKCKSCGGSFIEDELYIYNGYCEECAKETARGYKYKLVDCYKISQKTNSKNSVDIDFFLSCMFTPEQINEVLYRELVSSTAVAPVDCTPFIEADESWFIDVVMEEVNNNENKKN